MLFDRTIYRLPASTQETYWEDTWAAHDFDKLVASQPRKDWWDQLEKLPHQLADGELILEAGCGAGPVVYLMHRRGYRVRGVDTAKDTIARVKEIHPELDLAVQDVEHLDLPDRSVGLYISLGVVEHDPAGPDGILAEASRVTRDDGLVFITVPYHNLFRRVREPWWRLKYFVHRTVAQPLFGRPEMKFYQFAFSRAYVEELLRRHGFEVLEVRYCHTPVAVKKDLGGSVLARLYTRPDGKVDSNRLKKVANAFNRVSPRLMSHVLAITARRVPRKDA